MGEYANRPKGFNNKPIRRGMLYSDYTPQQIEKAITAPDFKEKCDRAERNMANAVDLMLALTVKGMESEFK